MRKKIYEIIEATNSKSSVLNIIYNFIMFFCIFISMIPLMDKKETTFYGIINTATLIIFLIDYILRLITADFELEKGVKSFFIYPITPMAIIDLISILPFIFSMSHSFRVLRLLRIIKTLRVFRSFKIFRYSKNFDRIVNVLKLEAKPLLAVLSLAMFYVLFTSLTMFSIEPQTFDNFFDAVYWSVISLTSIGYGDIYPVSDIGRAFTVISSIVGVAIIALPSGIITAGYMEILREDKSGGNNPPQ